MITGFVSFIIVSTAAYAIGRFCFDYGVIEAKLGALSACLAMIYASLPDDK